MDKAPIRGTKSLQDIYERCHFLITKPSCSFEVTSDDHWKQAMKIEMMKIKKNKTYHLVDKPENQKNHKS